MVSCRVNAVGDKAVFWSVALLYDDEPRAPFIYGTYPEVPTSITASAAGRLFFFMSWATNEAAVRSYHGTSKQ